MDAVSAQKTLNSIDTACGRISELRSRRLGGRTSEQLAEDITLLNRAMIVSENPQKGLLLSQKALLLNHDHVLNEVGNLQRMLKAVQDCLTDSNVQHEIHTAGYAVDKVFQRMNNNLKRLTLFRKTALAHERLLQQALGGISTQAQHLETIEGKLVQHDAWAERITTETHAALVRIKQHKNKNEKTLGRMAASLVLAVSNTA